MLVSDLHFNVQINRWLPCALGLAFRLIGPGLAWSWLWPPYRPNAASRPGTVWVSAAQVVVTGLLFSLATVLITAALRVYTPTAEWSAWGLVMVVGLALGWVRSRQRLMEQAGCAGPAIPLLIVGFAAVMLLPQRGEWVLGGWDPGIYINQGVLLNRSGSLHPVRDAFFEALDPAELSLFTRPLFNYLEAYPVVPLDPTQRALEPFFFPGTPSLIALLDRCGGLRAATRVNEFVGLLTILVFPAGIMVMTGRSSPGVFALAALVGQPLWLYHLHFPTSEMLQLLLLSGMMLVLPVRSCGLGPSFLFAGLLAMAEINRFSFLPFGLLFIGLLALGDQPRTDLGRMTLERLFQFGALGLGTLFDYLTTPTTIGRLAHIVPALLGTSLGLTAVILVLDARMLPRKFGAAGRRLADRGALGAGLAALTLILVLAYFRLVRFPGMARWNIRGAVSFLGWGWLIAALFGGAVLSLKRNVGGDDLKRWTLFLLAAWTVSLFFSDISPILPWAARRHVEFGVPLLALLTGVGLSFLWDFGRGRPWRRMPALALLLGLLALHAGTAVRAWSFTEHDGLTRVLAEVAEQTAPEDIIVADHFRWGTPLRFLYGRTVINGELYLQDPDPRRMRKALDVLRRFARQGRTVRFLTSTEAGLGVFPAAPESVRLDWASPPWLDREIIHSARARRFETKQKARIFRLYTWPAADLPAEGNSAETK